MGGIGDLGFLLLCFALVFVFKILILFSVLLVTCQYDNFKLLPEIFYFFKKIIWLLLWVGLVIWVPFLLLLLFSLISGPNF